MDNRVAGDASSQPKVSVIIPAYNAVTTIERALLSVLSQTWRELEVIVVDDGSTDATADVVSKVAKRDVRVKLYRQPNGGVASARNAAIENASGAYLALQDADDYSHPDRIARQVGFLMSNPECSFVGCGARLIDNSSRFLGMQFGTTNLAGSGKPSFVNPSIVFRRSLFDEFRYNESLRYGEDNDLLRRVQPQHRGTSIGLPLYFYVQGGAQLTSSDIVGTCVRSVAREELSHAAEQISTIKDAELHGLDIKKIHRRIYERLEYMLRLHGRSRDGAEFQSCIQTARDLVDTTRTTRARSEFQTLLAFYDLERSMISVLSGLRAGTVSRAGFAALSFRESKYRAHLFKMKLKFRKWEYQQR